MGTLRSIARQRPDLLLSAVPKAALTAFHLMNSYPVNIAVLRLLILERGGYGPKQGMKLRGCLRAYQHHSVFCLPRDLDCVPESEKQARGR